MIQNYTIRLKFALFLGAFFAFFTSVKAQSDVLELLPGSEKLSFDKKSGLERLSGNIVFTYQGNTMYCDSAHYKRETKEVWAFGKVHLNKADSLNLFCDKLYYNGKTKIAKLQGNVRVRDREYKITTSELEYDTKISKATYRGGGVIENIETTEKLSSKSGYFYPNTEESFFKGNVRYKSSEVEMTTDTLRYNYLKHRVYFYGKTKIIRKETELFCSKGWYDVQTEEGVLKENAEIHQEQRIIKGDSLFYSPRTFIATGTGNVSIKDTAQKIELTGSYFYSNDSLKQDLLTGCPLFISSKSNNKTYLRADSLFHYRDSVNKTMRISGYKNVVLFQDSVQAKADSLEYSFLDKKIAFFGSPKFWSKNSELTGDTLRIYMKNDSLIDKVHLKNNTFANSEVDSGKFYNQLAGKEIWAHFTGKEITFAIVTGNASSVFYPESEEKDSLGNVIKIRQGMNRIFSSSINMYLDSGEVVGVSFLEKPDGVFFPIDQIDEKEQFLKGFSWNPALRPKRWEDLMAF